MKVYDRYLGRAVDLPDLVEPGRYKVLRRTVLNRENELAAGDLLWSDGGSLCELEGETSRTFDRPESEQDGLTPDPVIDGAVQAVVNQLVPGSSELPSPVMPAQLGDIASPTHLELELSGVLERGHLQTIAARPRMAMRYDSELLPVSRARRLAHDAITRLASHSEDWLRREITGVVPRALKAEVSEDDIAIYENVVFARLLDRLETVLQERLRGVRTLVRKREEQERLENAERLDYRLRNALCNLWGLSFAAGSIAGEVDDTRDRLELLIGKIRQLKHGDLYAAIPRTSRVPLALRSTNILQHDPHYRCLRPLWILAHSSARSQASTAPERFAAARQRGERFGQYVGLLIRHALSASKLVSPSKVPGRYLFGTRLLTVTWSDHEWTLGLQDEPASLQFVPAWIGVRHWSTSVHRRVVFSHESTRLSDQSGGLEPGSYGILNPLEFYGVERVRHAVEHWLLATLLARYPFRVQPLPKEIRDRISQEIGAAVEVTGQGLEFSRAIDEGNVRRVSTKLIELHANTQVQQAIELAISDVRVLSTCRVCGNSLPMVSLVTSSNGFRAKCGCGHTWTLRRKAGTDALAVFQLGDTERPFSEAGSMNLTIALPP